MKKLIVILLLSAGFTAHSQMQVQNMVNYLRQKEYAKAKAAADGAIEHEKSKGEAKTWKYRGDVYKAIADTSAGDDVDPQAVEKALEAYITCLKMDKGKDIYKEDVKGNLVRTANATKHKAQWYVQQKEFAKAEKCYDLLEQSTEFDFDGAIKRNNITKEKMLFERFKMAKESGNKQRTIELADQMIKNGYKEIQLYLDMVKLSLLDKDTTAALSYIEKGKVYFEDNMQLIGTEIDIYLARKKTNVLKDRLTAAIEISPDNEALYAVLGQVNYKTGDFEGAEKNYLKALELKPDFESVNYNLGALYFNRGTEFNSKLNDLPPKETAKAKEYEEKVKENFAKAIPYLEKAYDVTPEEAYRQRLLQAHTRLGNTEKAALYRPKKK
jgi:tetratricopeptide (TPR) repeat protein